MKYTSDSKGWFINREKKNVHIILCIQKEHRPKVLIKCFYSCMRSTRLITQSHFNTPHNSESKAVTTLSWTLSLSLSVNKKDIHTTPFQRQMKPNDFKDFESKLQRRTNGINGKANIHHQMRTMTHRTRHCHFISKTFGHSQQSKGTSNPIWQNIDPNRLRHIRPVTVMMSRTTEQKAWHAHAK